MAWSNFLTSQEFWTAVSAISTTAVAVIAVWKENFIARPKLAMEIENFEGRQVRLGNEKPACYYHIRVKNLKPRVPAINVRVFCHSVKISGVKTETRRFQPPAQFVWAPAEFREISPNISVMPRIVDLVMYVENHAQLILILTPFTGEHILQRGENADFDIEVIADNIKTIVRKRILITWSSEDSIPVKLAGLRSLKVCGQLRLEMADSNQS